MILGLLTCAKKKLPVISPAWLLYSASPRFSQQYQSLTHRKVDRIVILSAQHGPVSADTVIEPYERVITELTEVELVAWTLRCREYIKSLAPTSVISYLSGGYCKNLLDGFNVEQLGGNMYERSATIGNMGKLLRGKQKVCWPMGWVLTFVAETRPTREELKTVLRARGYAEATVQAQLLRASICPLHRWAGDRLENKYVPT